MKDITDMEKDRQYMKMALELAQKGMGFTAPNPMVGAVIVKSGKVIGQGYHRKYGELHAEREALASCTEQPEGASGTLLPLRETASVCQCNPGIGDQTCDHWFLGP